jgi:hypothetical protein
LVQLELIYKTIHDDRAKGFSCDDDLRFTSLVLRCTPTAAFQPIQHRFSIATQLYEAIGMPPQICTTGPYPLGFPGAVWNGVFMINFMDSLRQKHFRSRRCESAQISRISKS